jgi:hypothetical protein
MWAHFNDHFDGIRQFQIPNPHRIFLIDNETFPSPVTPVYPSTTWCHQAMFGLYIPFAELTELDI